MSKYTYQLRNVAMFTSETEVKSWFKDYDLSDYLTEDQIDVILEAGLFTKDKLADKIYRHYYTREIGLETIGLFKIKVKDKLDLIIEKYAQLIYTNSLEYDLLVNEDYTETFNRSTGDNNISSSTNTGSGLTVGSDTPQGQISKTAILAGQYATTTAAVENTNTISNSSANMGTETFTRHVKGNHGISSTYQALIKQYRENILTIYTDIINELNELFMGVW